MELGRLSIAVLTCLLLLSLFAVGSSMPVAADDEYTISISGSVDTPTREVPVFGGKEISAIAKADIGDTITVDVEAPNSGTKYTTVLINEDQKTVDFVDMEGDDSGDYDLGDPRRPSYGTLYPGSYLFAVENSTTGAREKIHPLVIKGFETTVSAPDSATVGDQVDVDVSVTQLNDSATNNYVEIVVADDKQNITKTANKDGSQYTASFDTGELDTGSYNVYATVRGNEEIYGDEEIIYGISDGQSLSIESSDSGSTTEEEGSGGGGGAPVAPATERTTQGPTSTPTASGNTTATGTATTAPSTAPSGGGADTATEPPTQTPDASNSADTGNTSVTADTASTDVLTPSSSTPIQTDTRLPGFGFGALLVSSIICLLILKSRLQRR
jgi:hypothetical protein